jgi:hypothetical protein
MHGLHASDFMQKGKSAALQRYRITSRIFVPTTRVDIDIFSSLL